MSTRTSLVILVVLILLSASVNVLQFNAFASREDRWAKSFVLDSLFRLGVNRTILVDSDNSHSDHSLQYLHGQVLIDLIRVQPSIGELSTAYQQRYEQILSDLNNFRLGNPDLFSREKMIMDDSMYSRYIEWITGGDKPQ